MAVPVDFDGSNKTLVAPSGLESSIRPLRVFSAQGEIISCWKLDPEELRIINETGLIWVSVWSGETSPPILISGCPLVETLKSGENKADNTIFGVEFPIE